MTKFIKENNRSAKLTAAQVMEIREKYSSGRFTQGSLARDYGLGVAQIGRIVRGESWNSRSTPMLPPTAVEIDESTERVKRVWEDVQTRGVDVPLEPRSMPLKRMPKSAEVARRAAALGVAVTEEELRGNEEPPARSTGLSIPPSPLDGGEPPEETGGMGVAKLVEEKARAFSADRMLDEMQKEQNK